MFVVGIPLFSCSPAKCVSMNDQEYKKRPKVININSNELSFYPDSILANKCRGSRNNCKWYISKIMCSWCY